ncbi:calcineurin-like phosphoesterase family protein [Pontibacter ummariensis]|uniref:Calcineurin-like phosphoesterase n=1 Tax=Pontibacter ummariensis TaxID=1610492 RepID=A0A239DB12_9BACT|nr:metallophosphoesterase [Pontibacter ummariensis]PRY14334.1 calcineurin-like phosphoesterase family protein [Pontibacter ummariensis]SNS29467.1 Calcineurin-like phosphoesterase [Pontibacter ummariensis]
MYDIIGDIHGHADALEQLLQKLGYDNSRGYYRHPERKAIFVGDYIDRGPKIRETLQIVRTMAAQQQAIALMGNHELSAILYNTRDRKGNYLREHTDRNRSQHAKTVEQFRGREDEYADYIAWFKTLPLYYEEESFRVVHACWDEAHIQYLRDNLAHDRLTDQLLQSHYKPGSRLREAIEVTLKGKELQMPEGLYFTDKDGHPRSALRIKWWLSPEQMTYRQYSVSPYDSLTDEVIPETLIVGNKPYGPSEKPVFFGHYWLPGNATASVYEQNVCCVDYSVAKEGRLVAYRWNGEQRLDRRNLHDASPSGS